MQWKKMHWPLFVDSFNLLEVKAVPITILVDASGSIFKTSPYRKDFQSMLNKASQSTGPHGQLANKDYWTTKLTKRTSAIYSHLGENPDYAALIQTFEKLRQSESQIRSEHLEFMTGVAFKLRSETSKRQLTDFSESIAHWETALRLDPNQYIWRRRIQQYGPLLEKPYPFYDWVDTAIQKINDRGENPINGNFVLTESEKARPSKDQKLIKSKAGNRAAPDPLNRLQKGNGRYASVKVATIPSHPSPGQSFRAFVHLELSQPNFVQWNNEGALSQLYVAPSILNENPIHQFWENAPDNEYSIEQRVFDFELKCPKDLSQLNDKNAPLGYIVVNVCDKFTGVCFACRIDFSISPGPASKKQID